MEGTGRPRNRSLVVILLGALLGLIGLVLFAGGVWLAALGGSLYYVLAGAGLIVSGVLLARRRPAGAWLYLGIFVLTLFWALWEVGLDGWALMPRVAGPALLALLVLLALPLVAHWRWRSALGAAGSLIDPDWRSRILSPFVHPATMLVAASSAAIRIVVFMPCSSVNGP